MAHLSQGQTTTLWINIIYFLSHLAMVCAFNKRFSIRVNLEGKKSLVNISLYQLLPHFPESQILYLNQLKHVASQPEATGGACYLPDPRSGDSKLRLGRVDPWLNEREEPLMLELARDPPEKGKEEAAGVPTSCVPGTSLFLLPLGLPGPCLLFLLALCFFSFRTSTSSPLRDGMRLWLLPLLTPPLPLGVPTTGLEVL